MHQVLEGRCAAAEHRRQLLAHGFVHGRMLVEEMPGPGQGVSRGLVAAEQGDHDLVADLPVAHALARLLVLGGEQHAEQVVHVLAALPAFLDDAEDHRVQGGDRLLGGVLVRQGEPFRQEVGGHPGGDLLQGGAEALRHHPELAAVDAQAEHRLDDDSQREGHHFPADLDRIAFGARLFPLGEPLVHDLGHDRYEARHALVGERRLHEVPLAAPAIPFVDHQAIAEEEASALEHVALPIIVMIRHHDVVNMIGQRDEVDRSKSQIEANQVVIFEHHPGTEPGGIRQHSGQRPDQGIAVGGGRDSANRPVHSQSFDLSRHWTPPQDAVTTPPWCRFLVGAM